MPDRPGETAAPDRVRGRAAPDKPGQGPVTTMSGRIQSLPLRILPVAMLRTRRSGLGGTGSLHLIERHARVYRYAWTVLISGFFEPLFYLLSLGVGLGKLVGPVAGPGGHACGN